MRHALQFPAQFAGNLLTLAIVAGSTRADVLVVHATNGPFTTIQAAVDAASNGDTVLVKPGSYSDFIVDARSTAPLAPMGRSDARRGPGRLH